MIVTPSPLPGAYVIDVERVADERGFFGRIFADDEWAAHGMNPAISQCSVSYNERRGTLRGLHFQAAPHAEEKVVRCTSGAIFDVLVDLRLASPTYGAWWGVQLSASNRRSVFIPKGMAHGFITLEDQVEVFYMISVPYAAGFGRGIRWNDPAIGIAWPCEPQVISARDAAYPLLQLSAR